MELTVLYVGGMGRTVTTDDKPRDIVVERVERPGPAAIVERLLGKKDDIELIPGPSEIVEKDVLIKP
jgi:hypothetical protein